MRRLSLALAAAAALTLGIGGFAGQASAADMARKAPPPPPPLPIYNWTGIYFGVHFGGAWGRTQFDERCDEGIFSHEENNEVRIFDRLGSHDGVLNACGGTVGVVGQLLDFLPQNDYDFARFLTGNRGSSQISGPLAGFQVGFNWQNGPFLFGIEAQWSWARLKGDHEYNVHHIEDLFSGSATLLGTDRFFTRVEGIGTLAARFGLVTGPQDRTLVYGKFGVAYVRAEYAKVHDGDAIACLTVLFEFCAATNVDSVLTADQNRWGWMAGIGLEFGIWDNVTAKVEYNYIGLNKKTVRMTGTADVRLDTVFFIDETFQVDVARDFDIRHDIHLIKFGVNYRFNLFGAAAPIAARY